MNLMCYRLLFDVHVLEWQQIDIANTQTPQFVPTPQSLSIRFGEGFFQSRKTWYKNKHDSNVKFILSNIVKRSKVILIRFDW